MSDMDPLVELRSRLALERSDAIERRTQKLAEQAAETNSPGTRLRVWEDFHALRLPRELDHPLVKVIARDTGLTLEQVQEEQRQRAAARQAAGSKREVWDPYCGADMRARSKPQS